LYRTNHFSFSQVDGAATPNTSRSASYSKASSLAVGVNGSSSPQAIVAHIDKQKKKMNLTPEDDLGNF